MPLSTQSIYTSLQTSRKPKPSNPMFQNIRSKKILQKKETNIFAAVAYS
jgi:hypothetical protein